MHTVRVNLPVVAASAKMCLLNKSSSTAAGGMKSSVEMLPRILKYACKHLKTNYRKPRVVCTINIYDRCHDVERYTASKLY